MAEFVKSLDNSVFDTLVKRHYKGACTFAGNRLSNKESAYDAVQEAFISVVRNRKLYNTSRSFSSWFYTILCNICIDLYRKQTRYDKKIHNWTETIQLPDEPVNHDYVRDLLDQVSAQDKEILILRLVEELSFAEIADFYGCSVDAAKKRCQRALKRLRQNGMIS
ncbi:MAG: sigma-70 family RNA polymerase sigma factor [Kiritimatiellae bacterium]|nr:sigma-70 family RNA polymerase sigma factor [Kiritimatiellia bacterium]MDD5523001.1 sigma-70 family RNA polymerase sigma factor [Kiritimatiellia bacterium]